MKQTAPLTQSQFGVFAECMQNPESDLYQLSYLLTLEKDAYQDMAHGQKAAMIPADNQYTTQVLYRLGFHWSSTSWDYVDQMLVAIGGFGYFDEAK